METLKIGTWTLNIGHLDPTSSASAQLYDRPQHLRELQQEMRHGIRQRATVPGKPVAENYGLLSIDNGSTWGYSNL